MLCRHHRNALDVAAFRIGWFNGASPYRHGFRISKFDDNASGSIETVYMRRKVVVGEHLKPDTTKCPASHSLTLSTPHDKLDLR